MPTNYNYQNEKKPHTLAQKAAAISALLLLIIIGTISYHWLENWSWVQSFYFTVCTLTTVGYGDLYPTTDDTRFFTAIFILSGVSIALAALGLIGSSYIDKRARRITQSSRPLGRRRRDKF